MIPLAELWLLAPTRSSEPANVREPWLSLVLMQIQHLKLEMLQLLRGLLELPELLGLLQLLERLELLWFRLLGLQGL